MAQFQLTIDTPGRGTIEVTTQIQNCVQKTALKQGLCQVFIHHTSASLIICENADATVLADLEGFLGRLVPDGDPAYRHAAEGADDMAAHIRSVLTQSGLTVPVSAGRCALGTWQGIFVFEHRTSAHRRRLTVTVLG